MGPLGKGVAETLIWVLVAQVPALPDAEGEPNFRAASRKDRPDAYGACSLSSSCYVPISATDTAPPGPVRHEKQRIISGEPLTWLPWGRRL